MSTTISGKPVNPSLTSVIKYTINGVRHAISSKKIVKASFDETAGETTIVLTNGDKIVIKTQDDRFYNNLIGLMERVNA